MQSKTKKKSELFNTVEFVKYKSLVISIVGAADWKKATALYIKRYKDFDAFRGGYAKLMSVVNSVKTTGGRDLTATARAKHLNKALTAALTVFKADGYPKVGGKEYKAHESDIKEFTIDGDAPEYGKKDKK
jgi:hypothetical protein